MNVNTKMQSRSGTAFLSATKAAVLTLLYALTTPCAMPQLAKFEGVSDASLLASQPNEGPSAELPNASSYLANTHFIEGSSSADPQADQIGSASPLTGKRFPLRVLADEAQVVTSPARIRTRHLVWLLPLAGATAAAFATDTKTMRDVVSHDADFNANNATASDVLRGAAIGVPVLIFGVGQLARRDREREAGLLAGEAMVDAYIFDEAIKYVTLRERPYQDDARGHFFVGSASSNPSFVSGHSIVAWSSAAVLAGEYSKPWQQAAIYTLASGVSLTRVLGQQHFPSDTLLGSATGWLIGHYVFRAHHRKQIH